MNVLARSSDKPSLDVLVAWIAENPHAPVRFGRQRITVDFERRGDVGYLTAKGDGTVAFTPRHGRYERPIRSLAYLEIKVGRRYRPAVSVLHRSITEGMETP